MSGRTKCYAMAPLLADELRHALRREFMRDRAVTAQEAHLLMLADGVCAHTELVEQRVKVAMRVLGGGQVDRGIIASIRSLLSQCLRLMTQGKKNAPDDMYSSEANVELVA